MGQLPPGTNYIYERVDGVVYAREFGSGPDTRVAVGWDYDPRTSDGRPLHDHLKQAQLWSDIRQAAQKNVTLQDAMNRVVEIYHLSKNNNG